MEYNPFSLKDKTILITGASSGIGKVVAIMCSRMGATIVLNGRDQERLQVSFNELSTENGQQHIIIDSDLTNDEGIAKIAKETPNLDGIVHSAGVNTKALIQYVSRDKINDVFNINCFSPMLLTQGLLKSKKINKGSSIVMISSISSTYATISNCLYASSKGALNSLIRVMSLELSAKKIRVNGIMPGIIGSEMMKAYSLSDEELLEVKKTYPLGRFGQPQDVANGVIYLLSEASSWVTGINLVIDGGVTLR